MEMPRRREESMYGQEWWEFEKKLSEESPLILLPKLATTLGLNEAIILQQLHFKLLNSPLIEDGHKWYYQSYKKWHQMFPFWSEKTIQRTFQRLENQGIIVSSQQYNRFRMDKTKWYRIDYETFSRILESQNGTAS